MSRPPGAGTSSQTPPRRWTEKLFRVLLALTAGLCLGALVAAWLALQDQPRVDAGRPVTASDLVRVKSLLLAADPRLKPPGSVQRLQLAEQDLQLLLDDASRRLVGGAAQVAVEAGQARVELSLPLDRVRRYWAPLGSLRPFGSWLNLSTRWRATPSGWPQLTGLQLGNLPLPAGAVVWSLERLVAQHRLQGELAVALQLVDRVELASGQVALSYRWRSDLGDAVRAALIPPAEQERVRVYHAGIAEVIASVGGRADQPVALSRLIPPLCALAERRTSASAALTASGLHADTLAAKENKALLLALTLYANEVPPSRLIASAATWPAPPTRLVTLGGREDFPRHFLISAFVAAEGGGRLADAIGVYKEVVDARDGSGFSFNDLAADRAGTRFGQRAVHDAVRLQQAAGNPALRDTDLLPDVSDLPEFLPEAEFRRQYVKVGSPAYAKVLERIESRLAGMPLLN